MYEVFIDNFYSSPTLLEDLLKLEIVCTGTLNTRRTGVPPEVSQMKQIVEKSTIPRGTGYYFLSQSSVITYVVWHDTKTVTLASTGYAGRSDSKVVRRVKDPNTNTTTKTEVPCLYQYQENFQKHLGE